ncbi:MAG: SMP-30/gluconolactonase/LRE family protein [Polyangiaceae bacterium]
MLGIAACSEDAADGAGAGPGAASSSSGAHQGGSGGGGAGGSGATGGAGSGARGGDGGAPAQVPEVVAAFDAATGQLPEGLALDAAAGRALVGFATTGAIVAVDLDDGAVTPFGNLPQPPPDGFITGLALGADGSVYAALVSPDPAIPGGIYKVPAAGGAGVLFASDALMTFPNGIVVRADGGLLVSDSAAGAVFAADAQGTVDLWQQGGDLAGQNDFCGAPLNGFDIGANGIVQVGDSVFVANNDKGSIVRIPVEGDGTAGVPVLFVAPDCANLGGADGLAADAAGDLYLAVNHQNRLVRIAGDGATTTLAEGPPLDFPASPAILEAGGAATLYVTSFALAEALSGGSPEPALVSLSLAP